jgi:hypothetical protein
VEDLYRWNEALTQPGKLLSTHSLDQMFAIYPDAADRIAADLFDQPLETAK